MTTKYVVTDDQLGVLGRRYNDLFRRVREGTLPIEHVLRCMQDTAEGNFDSVPVVPRRLIDCDVVPYRPSNWQIKPQDQLTNIVRGQIEFDPNKFAFLLSEEQKNGKVIKGTALKDNLSSLGVTVYGAQVLDHLLANTALIPDSWKVDEQGRTRFIYFWGTIYRGSNGDLHVRYLCWYDGRWRWDVYWLGSEFDGQDPAAVLAS